MKTWIAVTLLVAVLSGCAGSPARKSSPGDVDLRELVLGATQGAQDRLMDGWYLDLDKTVAFQKIDRQQAVEIQNHMRDRLEDPKRSIQESYDLGLAEIRGGRMESGWKPVEKPGQGDFVVVVDSATPLLRGGAKVFDRLKKNPHYRGVVIYTTEEDRAALASLGAAEVKPDAAFTRNHLVLFKNAPLLLKDLRIIDPTLQHVVILESETERVMQPELTRRSPRAFAASFAPALEEIEESSRAAARLGISFAQAFKPYSKAGEEEFHALVRRMGSRKRALAELRGPGVARP